MADVHPPQPIPSYRGDAFLFAEDYLIFGLLVRRGYCFPGDHATLVALQRAGATPRPLAETLLSCPTLDVRHRGIIREFTALLADPRISGAAKPQVSEPSASPAETKAFTEQVSQHLTASMTGIAAVSPPSDTRDLGDHHDRKTHVPELERTAPIYDGATIAATEYETRAGSSMGAATIAGISPAEMARIQESSLKSPLIGTTLHGHVVIDRLGSGGQGDVYLAKQLSLNRYVAIKKLQVPFGASPGRFLDMFRQEAQTLAAINHARIVKVYEIFEKDGIAFFTMEYLKGQSLNDIVKSSGGAMPVDVVANLACQACSALARTSEDGLVHRDIKPANMMLDENGDLKIVDFGLSTVVAAFRAAGSFVGTPHYASPEQARLESVTPASDQYSLGVTFYYALTGELPFTAANAHDLLDKHVNAIPRPPTEINPQLPASIDRVILRMMEKDPAKRFPDFNACFSAWEEILQFESRSPAAATSQLLGESLLRFSRQEEQTIMNRSALLALAWLLLLGGTVLGEMRLRAHGLDGFLAFCGNFGSILLAFSLFCIFYVAAARRRFVPIVGSLRAWLYTHIATAIPSVALLLIHSGDFLRGVMPGPPKAKPILSIVMSIVLVVTAVSGSVGLLIFRQLRRRLLLGQLELRGNKLASRDAMLLLLGARFLSGWRLVHYPLAVFFILLSLAHILQWLRFRI